MKTLLKRPEGQHDAPTAAEAELGHTPDAYYAPEENEKPQGNDEPAYTARLWGELEETKFSLTDESGKEMEYGKDEKQSGKIALMEGTQVAILNPHSDGKRTAVVLWYNGQYRQGFVETRLLNGAAKEESMYAGDVFMQDAEHVLERLKLKSAFEVGRNVVPGKSWKDNIQKLEQNIADVRDGKLKLNPNVIEKAKTEQFNETYTNKDDKVDTVNRITKAMWKGYGPIEKNDHISNEVVFVPLSADWFATDPDLKTYFESDLVLQEPWNNLRNDNDVGSGIGQQPSPDLVKRFWSTAQVIQSMIAGKPQEKTVEGQWLNQLLKRNQDEIQSLIFLGGKVWDFGKEQAQASFVSTESTFGPFQIAPLMTLMMHETAVNSNSYTSSEDTHVPNDETKTANDKTKNGDFEKLKTGRDDLDDLFNANSTLQAIQLNYIFETIRNNQD